VLSLPPIINGEHSKITLDTRNVFIEVTGTDQTKINIVLNTMIAMYSGYCAKPFSVEAVEVIYEGKEKKSVITPDLSNRTMNAYVDQINKGIGCKITGEEMVSILSRMQLNTILEEKGVLKVTVPPTRTDILHPCDVLEDVAIAFGYNNIVKTVPKTVTVGLHNPLNKFTDYLRQAVSQAGYLEVLTWALCSHDENFAWMGLEDDGNTAVRLANAKTQEFSVVRSSLIPGLLKTLAANKAVNLPIKLFEVSDVVLIDKTADVGARNKRKLAAIYCSSTGGFEVVHGLLDRLMELMIFPIKVMF